MEVKLTELIAESKPRENSGPRTSKQYDYQKDLSLHILISYHEKGKDYVFVFDYHDDLLILDHSINPTNVDFLQIKSKHKNNWTLTHLMAPGDDGLSIIGKMYLNKINFKNFTKSLQFISNQPFSFKIAPKKTTVDEFSINCSQLTEKDLGLINANLKKEHSLAADAVFKEILFFERSKLSLEDSSTHCMGALAKLFQSLNPEHSANVELAYNKIFNEIRIKTAAIIQSGETPNWDLIKEKKGISRKEFDSILKVAGVYKSFETSWDEIQIILNANGMGYLNIQKLKANWRTVNATILSQTNNIPLTITIDYVNQKIMELKAEGIAAGLNLVGLLDEVKKRCTDLPSEAFESDFITALILRQLHHD